MWQEMDGALRVFEMYAARAFLSVVLANDRVNIQTPVKLHILTQDKGRKRLERIVKRSWEMRREGESHGEREEGEGERERSQEIKGDGKIERLWILDFNPRRWIMRSVRGWRKDVEKKKEARRRSHLTRRTI